MALTLLVLRQLAPPFQLAASANQAPTAQFAWSALGLAVTFTDESTDVDGSVLSWSWDFGDGNTSTERHPVHAFAAAGTYSVALTVVDDQGAPATVSRSITVGSVVTHPEHVFTFLGAPTREFTFRRQGAS